MTTTSVSLTATSSPAMIGSPPTQTARNGFRATAPFLMAAAPTTAVDLSLLDSEGKFTDVAHAQRLVDLHGDRIRYVEAWNNWIVWDGARWRRDPGGIHIAECAKDVGISLLRDAAAPGTSDERRAALAVAGKNALSANRIHAMSALGRGIPGVAIGVDQLDQRPWLLGVTNGVIDLNTGQLRAADPADFMTLQAPIAFDPDASCPMWDASLEHWFPDADVRAYVHRLAGAALVGRQVDHIFVIHIGTGRNGKGTFVRALEHVLGPDYATPPSMSLLVEQQHAEHPTAYASLRGKRLAVAAETSRRARLSEDQVKKLTGADAIAARGMHENWWSFIPSHSLWLQTNYLPEIRGRDKAIWSRVKVVEWTASFTGGADDRGLGDKLEAEAAGILAWAVRGCLGWQQHGLQEPEAVVRATLAYRQTQDVLDAFIRDVGLVFDKTAQTPVAAITSALKSWLDEEGTRLSAADVNRHLEQHARKANSRQAGETRQRVWIGVRLDGSSSSTNDPGTGGTYPSGFSA